MPIQVRPYPIAPAPAPATAHQLGRRLRSLLPTGPADGAAIALQRLVDLPVRFRWRPPELIADGPPSAHDQAHDHPHDHVGFELEAAERFDGGCFVSLPGGHAQALADRILGGEWPAPATPVAQLDPMSEGALVYVLARVLAALGGEYRVTRALPSPAAFATAFGAAGRVHWPASLEFAGVVVPLSVWLPSAALARTPAAGAGDLDLQRFADLALPIYACGGESHLRASELAELAVGDVVTCDACDLRPSAGGHRGRGELRLGGLPLRGMALRCEDAEMEVVMDDRTKTATVAEANRLAGDPTEEALALAGDAPVTVELELARFSLTVAELAALRAGDTLRANRPVRAPITLRVGQRAIARGDLVDIDGELGVRVTEVLGAPDTQS